VIVAAFVGMLRLRRAADRAWRIHQIRERRRAIVVRLVADTSGFMDGMRQAGSSLARLKLEMGYSRGPLERTGRQLDEIVERIRKAMRDAIPELRDGSPE
jgi:hypothetical protein